MKALILAAGYATRLWPLTLNKPKPLLPIKNKPIMEYAVDKICKISDMDKLYIVTNTKFVKHFKKWARKYKTDREIIIIDDKMKNVNQRRGSIGDILYSIEQENIKDDLLIVAGDNLFNFELGDFIGFSILHKQSATIGLFDIHDIELAKKYGIVAIDKEKRIVDFVEKPQNPPSTLAAMCVYFLPSNKINLIRQYRDEGLALDLAGNFISWLSKKETVLGYAFEGIWMDIGDKNNLKQAQRNYTEGK